MNSKKILTKEVLQVLGLGALVVASAAMPGLPKALIEIHKSFRDVNRKDFGRIIHRLSNQKMLSITENEGKFKVEITEKGKRRLLEYDFENISLKSQKRDGKWRLIIFDIPERNKSSREVFRKKLNELGFLRLQDSVFVSAFPCKNEIDFLCNFLGISDYVSLVKLDKIERGEELIFKKFPDFDDFP